MGVRTVTINAQGFYGGAGPDGALVHFNTDANNRDRLTKDVAIALGSATTWEVLDTQVTIEEGQFGTYWGIYAACNIDNAYNEDLIGAQFVDALLAHGWTEVDITQVASATWTPTKVAPTPKPSQTNTTVTITPKNTTQQVNNTPSTAQQSFVDLDPNSPTYLMTCVVNANGTWTCTDSSSETLTGSPTPQSKGFADLLKGEATTLGISTGVLLAIGVLAFAIINKD